MDKLKTIKIKKFDTQQKALDYQKKITGKNFDDGYIKRKDDHNLDTRRGNTIPFMVSENGDLYYVYTTPKENLNRYIQAQKSILRRAKDPETKSRIKQNILRHINSSSGYDPSFGNLRYSEVGGKIAKSLVPSEIDKKEKSLSKREKEAFPKKKPVEKAKGGMATSRSRKPRGVGVALRGYGKALK